MFVGARGCRERSLLVQRAADADAWLSGYVRVDHRCFHMLVAEQFLHGANVVARLQ